MTTRVIDAWTKTPGAGFVGAGVIKNDETLSPIEIGRRSLQAILKEIDNLTMEEVVEMTPEDFVGCLV